MNPTPSPSPHRLFFWLPLLLIALLATALATSRLWPQPVRDRLIRVLAAGSAPDQLPASDSGHRADAEGHDHDDHEGHNHDDHDHDDHDDHDHEGHVEAQALTISPQARRSIGLTEGTIALTTFQRTISVPGIVVERRGRSKYTIIAPMTGSVTKILVTEGEAVIPEQPLFEIRLTHEELVQSQADLLKTTEEVDVVRREIARLQGIGPEGIVAIKTILERKYELQKLEAVRTAQRQALLLHGLSAAQVDEILTQRTLLGTVTVSAPAAAAPLPAPQQATVLLVQELAVERGQHVTAGETLALLTDHETLLIEGETFEQDIPLPDHVVAKLNAGERVELVLTSKALNTSWNVQPENPNPNYNPHGCCVNHWYRVPVQLDPKATADVPGEVGDFANKPSGGKFTTPFRNLDPPPSDRKAMGAIR